MPTGSRLLLRYVSRLTVPSLRPLTGVALLSRALINISVVFGLCHPTNSFQSTLHDYNQLSRAARAARRDCGGNPTQRFPQPSVSRCTKTTGPNNKIFPLRRAHKSLALSLF